jgi:hypothetical protein
VSRATDGHERSLEEVRADVVARLRARHSQIEEAIFARVCEAGFGQVGGESVEYREGLRAAVSAAVELGLAGLEQSEVAQRRVPRAAIEQAHRAARLGVSLDTVLRRYIAGQALLADFIMEEAVHSGYRGDEAALHHHLRRTQTPVLEHLTASVIEAYADEAERTERSPEQRRAELVLGLLAGKQFDAAHPVELDYDFDAWHVGVIATGGRAAEFVRSVKAALGCGCLAIPRGERTTWAWFGRTRKFTVGDVKRMAITRTAGVSLAVGEPRKGIEGWRLTHQEAQAALPVALRKPPGLTRCSDVLLEAAVLQHDALTTSLMETFLSPLDGLGYRGQTARDTLRAYFEAKRNVSSTANRLGVVRNTVESRLREIEEKLGRPLHTCSAELEIALRLEVLGAASGLEESGSSTASWPAPSREILITDPIEHFAQSPRAPLSTLASQSSGTG